MAWPLKPHLLGPSSFEDITMWWEGKRCLGEAGEGLPPFFNLAVCKLPGCSAASLGKKRPFKRVASSEAEQLEEKDLSEAKQLEEKDLHVE